MNTEKEVTISELKAKFTKDYQSTNKFFFLEFTVGKCNGKTQVGVPNNGNIKEPVWKDSILLTYFDETYVSVKVYDDQTHQRECLGSGKIQIKSLRFPGGTIEVTFVTETGQAVGTLTGKYTIKNLTQTPLLLFKNMRVEFIKESKAISKARPYLHFSNEDGSTSTEIKEEINGLALTWTELLRLRIKQTNKISISLIDKDDNNGNLIFKYQSSAKEFKLQSGTKKFNVFNKDYDHLATVQFDYETLNFVSKEESVKGSDRQKKQEGQLTVIHIQKVNKSLNEGGFDIYYRFIVGINSLKTAVFQKTQKGDSTFSFKHTLLCEPRENKMIVLLMKKDIIGDKAIGVGHIDLESLHNGQRKIELKKEENKQVIGTVELVCSIAQHPCKILTIDNITASVAEDTTLVGQILPFVIFNVGSTSGRTETAHQNKVTFKKGIELKFCQEQAMQIQIWDEDVAKNELLYTQKINIKDLNSKGDHQVNLIKKEEGKPESKAKVTFKYQMKQQSGGSDIPRKQSQKKQQPIKQGKQANNSIQTEKPKGQQRKKTQQEAGKSKFQSSRLANNQSTGTIGLPAILAGSKAYGDHIFDKQSAATLQKSIVAFSMPKANRFGYDAKYSGEPSYCTDSCFKPNPAKGVGFGFGGKKQFPDWMERNMKENPPPGAYLQALHDYRSRGPTFGLSHKYYEKVFIPREKRTTSGLTGRKLSPINIQKK